MVNGKLEGKSNTKLLKEYELKAEVFMLCECLKATKSARGSFVDKIEAKLTELLELDVKKAE